MNEKAKELGLKTRTTPIPPGLEPANVSSAYDMARLIAFAGNDERIASIMRKSEQSVTTSRRTITVHNTNKLTRDGSDVQVKGGKTGFIRQAGYCLATLLQLPQGDPVAVVVLGARSNAGRFMETKHLFNWLASAPALLTNDPAKTAATAATASPSPRSRSLSSNCTRKTAEFLGPLDRLKCRSCPVRWVSTFHPRVPSPEVVELRRLRERQPQLASAIDLQLELLEMHRRMAARVSIPRNYREIPVLGERLARGETLLRYEDRARLGRIPAADARRLRFVAPFRDDGAEDVQRVHALTRDSQALEPLVRWWYKSMASPERAGDRRSRARKISSTRCCWRCGRSCRVRRKCCWREWIVRRGRARSVRCVAAIRSSACGRWMACVIWCAAAARGSGVSRKRPVRSVNRAIPRIGVRSRARRGRIAWMRAISASDISKDSMAARRIVR